MNAELSIEDQQKIEDIVEKRNKIFENILDVKKAQLAYLLEKERIRGIEAAKQKRANRSKNKLSKLKRKQNRRK